MNSIERDLIALINFFAINKSAKCVARGEAEQKSLLELHSFEPRLRFLVPIKEVKNTAVLSLHSGISWVLLDVPRLYFASWLQIKRRKGGGVWQRGLTLVSSARGSSVSKNSRIDNSG